MPAFNFIVFPYRDLYFAKRYGWSVRDLALLRALSRSSRVRSLRVIPRPISVYERLLGKVSCRYEAFTGKAKIDDVTSWDLLGPLKGRSWAETAYGEILGESEARAPATEVKVLLDFTPIAQIPYQLFPKSIVWYDLIDNFAKHNRFTSHQRALVNKKYALVDQRADFITGVSAAALCQFKNDNTLIVPNGLSADSALHQYADNEASYDLGFIGFITNKLDISLVRKLAVEGGMTVAMYGKIYDKSTGKALKKLPNVFLKGPFHDKELPLISTKFRVGVIPYLRSREHDGSPNKLYQYLSYGKPVVSSNAYPGETDRFDKYVYVVENSPATEVIERVRTLVCQAKEGGEKLRRRLSALIDNSMKWENKVDDILDRLEAISKR